MPKKEIIVKNIKESGAKGEEAKGIPPKSRTPQSLKGFKDILPDEQLYWSYILQQIVAIGQKYSFSRIDTPLLEPTVLFKRSIGDTTDIVEKEMYSFVAPSGENVSLRPEATASIVRVYIEHGMMNLPQPVKLYYVGPMFRHDRPQHGRYRQFHQVGFEVLGEANPAADAQMMLIAFQLLQSLGISVCLYVNSIGCVTCREAYKKELVAYYKTKKNILCKDCQRRLTRNPLRLLDCKESACKGLKEDAPQIVDSLCEECQTHFMAVLEYIDDLSVPYMLDAHLVRGLDYYNRTTFEVFPSAGENSKENGISLGGGGRYDSLVEHLGGRPTPAVGMALGMERIILMLKEKNIVLPQPPRPEILLAQIGVPAKRRAMKLFEDLYAQGFRIVENYVKDSLKSQLELAGQLGCRFVLIIGQKEVLDNTILIRDMEAGIQEVVDIAKVVPELQKQLQKMKMNHI